MWMQVRQTILGGCCTRCMLYSVYALLGVCCTRCMLYSVYALLGVCCTRCMLNSVYAVLSLCCTQCQLMIMTWRDREGLLDCVFCDESRVVDEKEGDEGWQWEQCDYERTWEIRGMTCLIGLGRPCIGVIARRIRTRTCCIGDGKSSRTWDSPSPSFSWCFPRTLSSLSFLSSILPSPKNTKLSHPLQSLHAMIKSQHRVQHTPSTAYTKYSIHSVLHTPGTAYTTYCIRRIQHHPKIDCHPLPATLQSLGRPCCAQFSTFAQSRVNQWIESQLPSRLSPELPPPDWPPRIVLLQYHSIMVIKCMCKLVWSRPPSVSLNSQDYGR